jgi:hypothetical protein
VRGQVRRSGCGSAYSQTPPREFRRDHFTGGWPYIDEVLFATPEQLATRLARRAGFEMIYEHAFGKEAGFRWAADGDTPTFCFMCRSRTLKPWL